MFPEFIEKLTQEVEGKDNGQEITVFSLSSCQWCKRCKKFLKDKNVKYRYVDLNQIDPGEKIKLLKYLREKYKPDRIAYPFLVCDDKFVIGYDPNKYEELLKPGGN
jgi:glutaredoxin